MNIIKWGALALLILIGVIAIAAPADRGTGWHKVGTLADGAKTFLVEMDPSHAKNRSTYDNAVGVLCRDIAVCTVAFFLPGDRIPVNALAREYFSKAGRENYPELAFWQGNRNSNYFDFTVWDCNRAGEVGSPPGSLCGKGVAEAYSAVLNLSGRASTGRACGWPKNRDAEIALAYIESVKNPQQQTQLRKGFALFSNSTGPDDRSDCVRIRAQVEAAAAEARKTLSNPK